MAKKNLNCSGKEFAQIAKSAKKETKTAFSSIYVICNELEKFAKGTINKIPNCENLSNENTKKVFSVLQQITKDKRAYSVSVLLGSGLYYYDMFGRVCVSSSKCSQTEKVNLMAGEIVTDCKGRELRLNNENEVIVCNPITLTHSSVLGEFARVAKVDITTKEKAAKAAAKEAKAKEKAEKAYNKAEKAVFALFGDITNLMTKEQIIEKYNIIRKTK